MECLRRFYELKPGSQGWCSASLPPSPGPPQGGPSAEGGEDNSSCLWQISSRTARVSCCLQGKGYQDSIPWTSSSLWWQAMWISIHRGNTSLTEYNESLKTWEVMRLHWRPAGCGQWPQPGGWGPVLGVSHNWLTPHCPGQQCVCQQGLHSSSAGHTSPANPP